MGLGGPPCAPSQPLGVPLCSPLLGSDVTFVVGREQQRVFAHRCVLACRCQAFRGMLGGCGEDPPGSVPPQGPFVLGNVQPDVFLAVIEFLYTNSVSLNSHIVSGEGGRKDLGWVDFFFFLGGAAWRKGQGLGSMGLVGAFQLGIFCFCRHWRC